MKKILSTLWLFLLCGSAFSQGVFLDKGKSGFEASATITGQNDKSYLGQARLGYSNFGIVDFGFTLADGKTRHMKNNISPGQNFLAVSPDLAVFLVKQDSRIPISLALNGSIEADAYYSDYLDMNYLRMSGDIYSLGASLYRKFSLNDKVKLMASAAARYCWERTVLQSSQFSVQQEFYGFISREENDYPKITLGLDALFKEPYDNLFRVGAAVGYDRSLNKDNFSGSLTVGIEIPWNTVWARWRYPRRYIIVPAEETIEYAPANTVQPPPSPADTAVINIPSVNGGYVPVKLVKYKNGYLGPQGEFYPGRPTVEQLKALYGN